jgi:putative AdoMet-dependent methyltransferase
MSRTDCAFRDGRGTDSSVGEESRASVSRSWWFPEYAPVGVELGTTVAVARYDANQGTDPARDDDLLDRLDVAEGMRLVDIGCGTGSFVIRAARRGAEAHGVDVSLAMLDYCKGRAEAVGVAAHWHHAGFLDYRHRGPRADLVTTKSALHQLPDAWKQQALLNAAAMLRPGGTFYLWDVAFSFDPRNADTELERWITSMGGTGFSVEDFTTHVRDEYTTYTWILSGLLDRAGLRVEHHVTPTPMYAEFVCRRS